MTQLEQTGTDRVCGMDEFHVEVVDIAQEAEQLKMKAEASKTSPDEVEEVGCVETLPCHIEVM